MTRLSPARWPLRTRVTLAYLASTALALAALGGFVLLRLDAALDDRLHETVSAESDRLASLSRAALPAAVRDLRGETHAQLLDSQGRILASSASVYGRLGPGPPIEAGQAPLWQEGTVSILDDDHAESGRGDRERERFVLTTRAVRDGVLIVGTSREAADEALWALRTQFAIGGAATLALASGLGYWVAGVGLRPIERMRTRAATISSRSAGERLPIPPAEDELKRLAETLNAMLERLDEGLRRERRFVAEASHDLRTPLALMRTEIELALARPRSSDELAAALRSLDDEVRRLVALAEDLLGRAGEAESSLVIRSDRVDLVALAERVAARFRIAAGSRTVAVEAVSAVEIRGDVPRLDRALSNLIDNALRHGAGDVTIGVGRTDDGATVTVSDAGREWGSPASQDATAGGLGLAIVREIAWAHGGSVEIGDEDGHTRVSLRVASPRD